MSHYSDFMASLKSFSMRGSLGSLDGINAFILREPERMRGALVSEGLLPLVSDRWYITSFFGNPKRLMFVWGKEILNHSIPLKQLPYFEERVKKDGVPVEDEKAFRHALALQIRLYRGMALERLRIFAFQLKNLKEPSELDGATLRSFHGDLCEDRASMRKTLSLREDRDPGDCVRAMAKLEYQIMLLERLIDSKKGP